MTTTTTTLPEWVVPDAAAVIVGGGRVVATRTRILRITPTGLVRVESGETFKPTKFGHLHKTGERGPRVGYNGPTELVSAGEYFQTRARSIVEQARRDVQAVERPKSEPMAALLRMSEIILGARRRLSIAQRDLDAHLRGET